MKPTLLCITALCLSGVAHAGQSIPVDVPEPSGIDIDRQGDRIFVADDGGEVWVFDRDYAPIDTFDIGGDLEGIAYLPFLDQLLVAAEGDEQLLLVDPDSGDLVDVFDIPRDINGQPILAAGGNGIEALTLAGLRIFVANQSFDPSDTEDGSILVELGFTPAGTLEILRAHPLPMLDVAGSFYSAAHNELVLLSDSDNQAYRIKLRAIDRLDPGMAIPADLFRSFWVPGDNQEGLCVVDGDLIIAQDSGDLYDAGSLEWLMSPSGQREVALEWGY